MGINGLMKLLSDECPGAIREQELKNLTGRKVAIDASMVMYQFLVAVRSTGSAYGAAQLTNDAGEVTSHVQGMFNRTIKLLAAGLKPVYVFDGKPPDMKGGELEKRLARRKLAEAELAKAKELGSEEDIDKYNRRLVKVGKSHNDDCKELLRLMGVPVVCAPCEAEAQCAELAKHNKVYATATEDMDALTFRTPKLLRKLTFSQGSKAQPIVEIDFELAMSGLDLTYHQFVDLCILCGCDYCCSVKGVGPKTALKLIRQHKTIEAVLAHIKKETKFSVPKDFTQYRVKLEPVKEAEKEEEQVKEEDVKEEQVEQGAGMEVDQKEVETETDTAMEQSSSSSSSSSSQEQEQEQEQVPDSSTATDELKSTSPPPPATSVPDLDDIELELSEDDMCDTDEEGEEQQEEQQEEEEEEEGAEYVTVEPLFLRARELFLSCDVTPAAEVELKWTPPLEDELKAFLVDKMGFNEDRVANGIKRLMEAQQKKAQQRMDSFFKPLPQTAAGIKRKATAGGKAGAKGGKAAKGSGGKPRR